MSVGRRQASGEGPSVVGAADFVVGLQVSEGGCEGLIADLEYVAELGLGEWVGVLVKGVEDVLVEVFLLGWGW